LSLLYRLGAFFFYFGLACAVLSSVFIAVLLGMSSMGVPVSSVLKSFATLFSFELMLGALIGVVANRALPYLQNVPVIGAFMPQTAGSVSTWFFLTTFLPVYAPLATVTTYLIQLAPLPVVVSAGLSASLHAL
jgi:hypothetical protein